MFATLVFPAAQAEQPEQVAGAPAVHVIAVVSVL
jgi:hypothetical protein